MHNTLLIEHYKLYLKLLLGSLHINHAISKIIIKGNCPEIEFEVQYIKKNLKKLLCCFC